MLCCVCYNQITPINLNVSQDYVRKKSRKGNKTQRNRIMKNGYFEIRWLSVTLLEAKEDTQRDVGNKTQSTSDG